MWARHREPFARNTTRGKPRFRLQDALLGIIDGARINKAPTIQDKRSSLRHGASVTKALDERLLSKVHMQRLYGLSTEMK